MSITFDTELFIGEVLFVIAVLFGLITIVGIDPSELWGWLPHSNIRNDKGDELDISELYPRGTLPRIPSATSTTPSKLPDSNDNIFSWTDDLHSPQAVRWIENQKSCYDAVMSSKIYDDRIRILSQRYRRSFSQGMKTVFAPYQRGRYFFYYKKDKFPTDPSQASSLIGWESQPSLYYTKEIRIEGKLILDASNLFINHGLILNGTWISDDGYKIAYGISKYRQDHNISSPTSTMTSSGDSIADDETNIYIRDVLTAEDSKIDTLSGCRVDDTSISWLEGHLGFFYTRYYHFINGIRSCKPVLYFHRIKTSQDEDMLIYEDESLEPDSPAARFRTYVPLVSNDGHYLIVEEYDHIHSSRAPIQQQSLTDELGSPCPGHQIHYRDISIFDGKRMDTIGPHQTLIESFDYRFEYISNLQDKFWFRTNYLASVFRIVQITLPSSESNWPYDIKSSIGDPVRSPTNHKKRTTKVIPKKKAWTLGLEFVPEHRDGGILIRSFISAKSVLVLQYLVKGCHEIVLYDLLQSTTGLPLSHSIATLPHPQFGAIKAIHCNYNSSNIFYEFSSMNDPMSVYRSIVRRNQNTGFIELSFDQLCRSSVSGIDLISYDTLQDFLTDKSETAQIPFFLFSSRQNLDKEADRDPRPCILFAYGGFGVSALPTFSLPFLLWTASFDSLVCLVDIQGGGECGRSWHTQGSGRFKYRSVDDVIAMAEYLITHRYTTPDQLILLSGSVGGFAMANAAIQRPELFSAVVIEDGLFDLTCSDKNDVYMKACLSDMSDESLLADGEKYSDHLVGLSPLHHLNKLFQKLPSTVSSSLNPSSSKIPHFFLWTGMLP